MFNSIFFNCNSVDYVSLIHSNEQVVLVLEGLTKAAKLESNIYARMTTEPILVINQWQGVPGMFESPLYAVQCYHNYKQLFLQFSF